MANPWFRLYSEFATDPKVQMLSESDQRRYIMLLCLRCSNEDVTLHETEVAFQLRITETEWAKTKAVLVAKKLISEDGKPTAWDKRQFVSDSSGPRVAAYRERKKLEEKRARNVTVTPPDTETETEKSSSPLPPSPDPIPRDGNPPSTKAVARKSVTPKRPVPVATSSTDPVCKLAEQSHRLAEEALSQVREIQGIPEDGAEARKQLLAKFHIVGVRPHG